MPQYPTIYLFLLGKGGNPYVSKPYIKTKVQVCFLPCPQHEKIQIQTSLTTVERSIMRYENLIEDCRMQEEEANQEEISHEQEEVTDAEMVDEEERGDPEPSDPHGEADTEGPPSLDPVGDAVSPEEDAFLMQLASQSVDPTTGSHSPRSETGTVSGEMAELSLTSPSQPGPGEDETQP